MFEPPEDRDSLRLKLIAIAGMSLILILIGGVFYHFAEGWPWIESIYFATISLTARGFSEKHPTNVISLIFSIVYLLIGVSFILASASSLIAYYMHFYEPKFRRKISKVWDNFMPEPKKEKWVWIKPKQRRAEKGFFFKR